MNLNKIMKTATATALLLGCSLTAAPLQAEEGSGLFYQPGAITLDYDNNVIWDNLPVAFVEWYGNGVKRVPVSPGVKSSPIEGTRFTFVMEDGRYLLLDCGNNKLQLSLVRLDCSGRDASGRPVGVLVVDSSAAS